MRTVTWTHSYDDKGVVTAFMQVDGAWRYAFAVKAEDQSHAEEEGIYERGPDGLIYEVAAADADYAPHQVDDEWIGIERHLLDKNLVAVIDSLLVRYIDKDYVAA